MHMYMCIYKRQIHKQKELEKVSQLMDELYRLLTLAYEPLTIVDDSFIENLQNYILRL